MYEETEMTQTERMYRNIVPLLKERVAGINKWIAYYENTIQVLYQDRCPHAHPQLGDETRKYCDDCKKTLE